MKFIKTFFSIIGMHLAMCVVPFFFISILNGDPKYNVDAPKSAGQIIIYAVYFLLFVSAYFYIGRISGGKLPENRLHTGGILGRVFSSLIIMTTGVLVYHCIIVPQRLDSGFWSIFAMPQLMARRVVTDEVIGNKIVATVAMLLPGLLIWAGFASNGFKNKK